MRRQSAPTNATPSPLARFDECPHRDAHLRSAARHCHPPITRPSFMSRLERIRTLPVVYGGNRAGLFVALALVAPCLKIGLGPVRRTKGGAGLPPPLMTESSSRVSRVTMLAWNYAARVLLFPDRATFAFLADFVATNPVSIGAAAAALLPELSTAVVRLSR